MPLKPKTLKIKKTLKKRVVKKSNKKKGNNKSLKKMSGGGRVKVIIDTCMNNTTNVEKFHKEYNYDDDKTIYEIKNDYCSFFKTLIGDDTKTTKPNNTSPDGELMTNISFSQSNWIFYHVKPDVSTPISIESTTKLSSLVDSTSNNSLPTVKLIFAYIGPPRKRFFSFSFIPPPNPPLEKIKCNSLPLFTRQKTDHII
jgi:hypothetical protein